MITRLAFDVFGIARPQGSKRFVGVSKSGKGLMIEQTAEHTKAWRDSVMSAALEAMEREGRSRFPIEGGATMEVTYVFARPKGHYGTGRNSGRIRPSAPHNHFQKPDLSKLDRALEDALTQVGVWRDDAQVQRRISAKRWGSVNVASVVVRTELAWFEGMEVVDGETA